MNTYNNLIVFIAVVESTMDQYLKPKKVLISLSHDYMISILFNHFEMIFKVNLNKLIKDLKATVLELIVIISLLKVT